MAAKKYKKLTNKEKQLNKECRARLREDGILPPVKARLNRNKFAKEVMEEVNKDFGMYTDFQYLIDAISWMIPHKWETETRGRITDQHIAILKMLKLAIDIKKYKESLKEQGVKTYSLDELYKQVIKPILDL